MISFIETNPRMPTIDIVACISLAFAVPCSELLTGAATIGWPVRPSRSRRSLQTTVIEGLKNNLSLFGGGVNV
jgi:hypothetical protein